MKLDGDKLLADIKAEIKYYEDGRDSDIRSGWIETAARKHREVIGMNHIKQLIELGDCTIK